jgi:hypothetical protein
MQGRSSRMTCAGSALASSLAPHLRVTAYDRAGICGSAPAPGLVLVDPGDRPDAVADTILGVAAQARASGG